MCKVWSNSEEAGYTRLNVEKVHIEGRRVYPGCERTARKKEKGLREELRGRRRKRKSRGEVWAFLSKWKLSRDYVLYSTDNFRKILPDARHNSALVKSAYSRRSSVLWISREKRKSADNLRRVEQEGFQGRGVYLPSLRAADRPTDRPIDQRTDRSNFPFIGIPFSG